MSKLSNKEVDRLIKTKPDIRNDLKLSDSDSTIYFQLVNGNILLFFSDNGSGVLFDSEIHLKKFREKVLSQKSKHILAGVYEDENDFHRVLGEAPGILSEYLSMLEKELDKSFNSLKQIDYQLKDKKISFDFYIEYIYKYLICYIGEVIIKNKKGRWQLELDEGVLEPFVLLESRKLVNVFIDLYNDAQDDWNSFSVFTTAHLRLDSLN